MTSESAGPTPPRGRLRRALVTGANGFVGGHVVTALASRGVEVVAVGRDGEASGPSRAHAYLACDLTDLAEVEKLPLDEIDTVINLAGLAAVGPSFAQRDRYLEVNVGVLRTVCEVAAKRGLTDLRVIAVSSGAVYAAGQPMPLSEDAKVDPTSSPYAESKLAMEECARAYRSTGVDCVVVRPFNHIGPGQGPGFLVPDLFAQIQQVRDRGGPMLVGNLETRRDYTDVRDVAAAYVQLADRPVLTDPLFNVCRGRSWSGSEILTGLLAAAGSPELDVRPDPARFRPSDQPDIVGDNSRLAAQAGWAPTIPLEESLRDFVAGHPVG